MTNEEALNFFETFINLMRINGEQEIMKNNYSQSAIKAIEAIGKQIPKKLTHEATLIRCCTCPTCKNVLDEFEEFVPNGGKIRIKTQHCKFCGQALDWSDI